MKRSLLPDRVEAYVSETIVRETDLQRRLRAETAGMAHAGMQIGAHQGALLALLVRSSRCWCARSVPVDAWR